eukprot:TRINITY_DN63280_c0_g1_i1.p2 TRINITY_DN63280_c0_g1~~TRINITY_DN63280_c0_g1_i1.p2  ORF type:complete len:164 (+),score=30.96 TRINITY_DN63280_c0_g1_i1:100-591(+)
MLRSLVGSEMCIRDSGYPYRCGTTAHRQRHFPYNELHQHWQEAHRSRAQFMNAAPRRKPLDSTKLTERTTGEFEAMLAQIQHGVDEQRDRDIRALVFDRTNPWILNNRWFLHKAPRAHVGWVSPKANWEKMQAPNPVPRSPDHQVISEDFAPAQISMLSLIHI